MSKIDALIHDLRRIAALRVMPRKSEMFAINYPDEWMGYLDDVYGFKEIVHIPVKTYQHVSPFLSIAGLNYYLPRALLAFLEGKIDVDHPIVGNILNITDIRESQRNLRHYELGTGLKRLLNADEREIISSAYEKVSDHFQDELDNYSYASQIRNYANYLVR